MIVTELSSADVQTRVQWFAEDADLSWVVDALLLAPEPILACWLEAIHL
jgi:hypothetical protein